MSGGSSLPYGNVKNLFILSCSPSGPTVSSTSVYVSGTFGSVITFNAPGVLPGDVILDVNRTSSTVNGSTAPAYQYVVVGSALVNSANTISCVLSNTSVSAYCTVPIENYLISVGRPDTPNAPTTIPSGIY